MLHSVASEYRSTETPLHVFNIYEFHFVLSIGRFYICSSAMQGQYTQDRFASIDRG